MREFKVTNRTQGRLEIKEVRAVLDAGASRIIAEPLPESVRYMMGGGPRRKLDVVEVFRNAARAPHRAPARTQPAAAQPASGEPDTGRRGGKPRGDKAE